MMRRTGLRTYTQLKPGKPLQRRTPLAEVGKRATKAGKKPRRPDTGPDRSTRELVQVRDSGCVMCGAGPYGLQVHHRKPRRMGGRTGPGINSPANLVTLCAADHEWAESARTEAYDLGLLVREHDDPADIPVIHRLHGLAFLRADGSVELVPDVHGGAA